MEEGLVCLVSPTLPSLQVTRVEKLTGSVGKTIEAFYRAQAVQTASLSAKYFKTITLKMPFHNCPPPLPFQQETKPCPTFKATSRQSSNSSQTCPPPKNTCHFVTDVDIFTAPLVSHSLNGFVVYPQMCLQTLRETDTHRKLLRDTLWARPDLLMWIIFSHPKVSPWNEARKGCFITSEWEDGPAETSLPQFGLCYTRERLDE